jgi:hypothetical protein
MQGYSKYIYDGPVLVFDKCVADHWRGETMAPSEKKARTNLAYQFKKQNNKVGGTKVSLPGTITKVG